jgi:hypothetical protein
MATVIGEERPWILCEVLHRDAHADRRQYLDRCSELMALVRSYGYEVRRLVQSSDGKRVEGLLPTAEFPDRIYDRSSVTECDYLFVPAGEKVDGILSGSAD